MAGADLAGTFRSPFPEQVAAWRLRLRELRPSYAWDQYEPQAHARAFMVAGATKADLLSSIAAAVDRSIVEGRTLEEFRRDFREITDRLGWPGKAGAGSARGFAWRTRVIYQTNMRTTYMAARHAQLLKGSYAFWVYRHSGAAEPRPEHLGWDGLALPPDHPFWATHFPPNGWGCGCEVSGADTEKEVRRMGGDPGKALPEGWDARDPRTGAPKGIDKGWDYAMGAEEARAVQAMAAKAIRWPTATAIAFMRDVPDDTRDQLSSAFRRLGELRQELWRFAERSVRERGGQPITSLLNDEPLRTLGLVTRQQAEEVRRLSGVDATLFDITLDRDAVIHALDRHGTESVERTRGQRALTAADFARLPEIVEAPDQVEHSTGNNPEDFVVIYRKVIGAERFVAMFVIRGRRRRLALKTLWIERVAGGPRP